MVGTAAGIRTIVVYWLIDCNERPMRSMNALSQNIKIKRNVKLSGPTSKLQPGVISEPRIPNMGSVITKYNVVKYIRRFNAPHGHNISSIEDIVILIELNLEKLFKG